MCASTSVGRALGSDAFDHALMYSYALAVVTATDSHGETVLGDVHGLFVTPFGGGGDEPAAALGTIGDHHAGAGVATP